MKTTVTFDAEQDKNHPEIIRRIIKIMRDEGDFEDIACPHTPENLVRNIVRRCGDVIDSKIIVLYTLEMALVLRETGCRDVTVATQKECRVTRHIASRMECNYLNLSELDLDYGDLNGKFDVVMGNPPYHGIEEGNRKSQAVWPYYVELGLRLLKDNGKFAMIHPSGWRSVGVSFQGVNEEMRKLDFEWLAMHDESSGQKVFGEFTRYDVYVARKSNTPNQVTEIQDANGNVAMRNIKEMDFIADNILNMR